MEELIGILGERFEVFLNMYRTGFNGFVLGRDMNGRESCVTPSEFNKYFSALVNSEFLQHRKLNDLCSIYSATPKLLNLL